MSRRTSRAVRTAPTDDHAWIGFGCSCGWRSEDTRLSLRDDHAAHVAQVESAAPSAFSPPVDRHDLHVLLRVGCPDCEAAYESSLPPPLGQGGPAWGSAGA